MKLAKQSSKPVKVRKILSHNSVREKSAGFMRATLSSELRTKHNRRTVRVRTGDNVKLVRGEYSGVEGKVLKIFPKEGRLTIEGVTREKIAGGTTPIRIHASNVVVTGLNFDDKLRREKIGSS